MRRKLGDFLIRKILFIHVLYLGTTLVVPNAAAKSIWALAPAIVHLRQIFPQLRLIHTEAQRMLIVKTRWIVGMAVVGLVLATTLQAQDCRNTEKLPQFEVATIKPFNPHGGLAGVMNFGGQIMLGHVTVRNMLTLACGVEEAQVSGGPDWIDRTFVNVSAKLPEAASGSKTKPASIREPLDEVQRQMLLALLVERYHLRFHVEQKKTEVYFLELSNSTLKLNVPEDPSAQVWFGGIDGGSITEPTGIAATNIAMQVLAERLSRYFQRPVLDRTGVKGSYDFRSKLARSDSDPKATPEQLQQAIEAALHALGLKLTAASAPVSSILIDSVQEPTPN